MKLQRREFLASLPALASLPLLPSLDAETKAILDGEPIGPLKVFCISDWSDSHYIIARDGKLAAHWWYKILGGEPVPKNIEIEEVDPDEMIRCGIEDLEIAATEDHLYAIIKVDELELKVCVGKDVSLDDLAKYKHAQVSLYVDKPAKLYLQQAIENKYPMPCCFCTTAG